MSFFSRLMAKMNELVQDDFTNQLTEHQVLAIINKERQNSIATSIQLKRPNSISSENVFKTIQKISQYTPEIQFRLLGTDPTIEDINSRKKELNEKLAIVQTYLLENSPEYMTKINSSLKQLQDIRGFYSGRMKSQELRNIIQKLKRVLDCSRRITKLNIKLKNIKSTVKIVSKIPNVKKMSLIELKTINWDELNKLDKQIQNISSDKLVKLNCIDKLYSYVNKMSNQSFYFVIEKIKLCLQDFDSNVYEEVIRNYIVISPNTSLQPLIISLLEEKIRTFYDINIEQIQEITRIGNKVMVFMTNLHKIIKWHRINKAIKRKITEQAQLNGQKTRKHRLSFDMSSFSEEQKRSRCMSIDSLHQEQGIVTIQLTEQVLIDPSSIKSTFSRTIDSCLSDLISDHILISELSETRFYEYIYMLSKISQTCYNFTGLNFQKLRKIIMDFSSKKEFQLYIKSAEQLHNSLDLQRNEWNRQPYHNNYRYKNLDKCMYRYDMMHQLQEYKRIIRSVEKLFNPRQRDMAEIKKILEEQDQNQEQISLQFNLVRLPSFQRIDKNFYSWKPEEYMKSLEGQDAVVCQSSSKMLNILQRYFQFLMFVPKFQQFQTYISHILILVEYYIYYIYLKFLTAAYKNIFFDHFNPEASIDKKYTKRRLAYLYPYLSQFVTKFKRSIESNDSSSIKFYMNFRKEVREMIVTPDNTSQILRAKVVATESIKFVMAYVTQMFNRIIPLSNESSQNVQLLWQKLKTCITISKELSVILLTESSQKMVGLELQTMKNLFKSIRWYEPFEELKEYMNKFVSLIKQSYERLKSSNRGEIPSQAIDRIFVLIWRTLMTYAIKLFLEGNNNTKQSKKNFELFLDEMYNNFSGTTSQKNELTQPYKIFKGIFLILNSDDWQECRQKLLTTMKNYDYIYSILMSLLQNSESVRNMEEKDRELCRKQLKQEIQEIVNAKDT